MGTDPSADSGVVSEDWAAATLPPASLAYNTNAINPTVTQPDSSAVTIHHYPANSANSMLRFTLNQDTTSGAAAGTMGQYADEPCFEGSAAGREYRRPSWHGNSKWCEGSRQRICRAVP